VAVRIEGVIVKDLQIHKDERGTFSEIIRRTDKIFKSKFAQLNYSIVFPGVTKAWHLHKKQTDWMCVIAGDMKLVLYDTRPKSKTYKNLIEILMGQTFGLKAIKVPPGVAHGYKVINGPMYILYLIDKEYDGTDELRISYDDPQINYDWQAGAPIK
jgi:dTDP-4-dehydrorhamnose 3,5-epimerase